MPTVTVQVPEELKKKMDKHETTNWSAVARKAFEQQMREQDVLERIRELTKNSTMTEEDAIRIGGEVNKKVSEKYLKLWKSSGHDRKVSGKSG